MKTVGNVEMFVPRVRGIYIRLLFPYCPFLKKTGNKPSRRTHFLQQVGKLVLTELDQEQSRKITGKGILDKKSKQTGADSCQELKINQWLIGLNTVLLLMVIILL